MSIIRVRTLLRPHSCARMRYGGCRWRRDAEEWAPEPPGPTAAAGEKNGTQRWLQQRHVLAGFPMWRWGSRKIPIGQEGEAWAQVCKRDVKKPSTRYLRSSCVEGRGIGVYLRARAILCSSRRIVTRASLTDAPTKWLTRSAEVGAAAQTGMGESEGDRLQQARVEYMKRAVETGAVQEVRPSLPSSFSAPSSRGAPPCQSGLLPTPP